MVFEKAYAGIDLGGTKMLAVIADAQGKVLASEEQPTLADEGAESVMSRMAGMVRRLIALGGRQVSGLGVATAGTLDPEDGTVRYAGNLGWTQVPLGRTLERELGLKVTVENDANAAAYGEWKAGAGRGTRNCVFVTVSTGIGGGIVEGGRLIRGWTASAGEIGHLTIDWNGPACGCGNVGCLELYASGTAIGKAGAAAAAADPAAGRAMLDLAGGDAARITSREVAAAAEGGNPLALKLLRNAGRALGAGLASVVHLANPELIVLGGGASKIGAPLLGPMEEEFRRRVIPSLGEKVRIVPPELGVPAGAIGAALMAE
ncbi:ROK family protein [Cohnella sp. CFH 77786]|uniref:ROK family protein n=1 Tax=Cohnella sp. CFH 77786 TaxID=2662265 RepID=UPI001C610CD7|nr:ROK family protein [Cohnella sp. CFH 77786]MBW5445597.1 ROK family protein [Cohnella sp. CFH 77786]